MWIVFNRHDSWECGYSVSSESEARDICKENEKLDYCYVGLQTMCGC